MRVTCYIEYYKLSLDYIHAIFFELKLFYLYDRFVKYEFKVFYFRKRCPFHKRS